MLGRFVSSAIQAVLDNPVAMERVNKLMLMRTKQCLECRLRGQDYDSNPLTKKGACKVKLAELREGKVCQLCGCDDALELDHRDPTTKMRDARGKPVNLSEWYRWSSLGGPDAMEREAALCDILCCNCHAMQPTNNVFMAVSSSSLPDVSQQVDQAAYAKKHWLRVKEEKQAYVNAIKLRIGKCAICTLEVVPVGAVWRPGQSGYPNVFEFAHLSELHKGDHEGKYGSVAKSVHCRNVLASVKANIDRETHPSRSRLLCACCHRVETIARNQEPGPPPLF